MKLVSLHIDNFGKFYNFDLNFREGLNQFIEKNGWGKSTITAFIKVMFYGFDNSSKRDSYENEKKRYKPWNGGVYGGNITFQLNNKCYTIYRTFETKDKDDTFRLVDTSTRLDSDDYSSNIGYEILKIDSDTFKKTLCIYENNCVTESTGDIAALLGNELSDTDDVNNFDKVIKNMDDKLNALSPTRKTGELYKQKEQIAMIQAALKEMSVIEESIDSTIDYIKDKEKQVKKLALDKQHIKEEIDKASQYKDMQSILKQYDIYRRQLEEKKQIYDDKMDELGILPDIKSVQTNIMYADKALDIYIRLKELELNQTQYKRLCELKAEVSEYTHDEIKRQINNIKQLDELKSEIQNELSAAHEYESQNRQNAASDDNHNYNESNKNINNKMTKKPGKISLFAGVIAGLLFIVMGAITGAGIFLIPFGVIFIIVSILYNKKKAFDIHFGDTGNKNVNKSAPGLNVQEKIEHTESIYTHINELKSSYKKQYSKIKEWLDSHNIEWGPNVVYKLSTIDNGLYEYDRLIKQQHDYNARYTESGIEEYVRNICTFLGEYHDYMSSELTYMLSDDNKKLDIMLLIKECNNCLYKIKQNIETIGHIRNEYDNAYDALNTFESKHKGIDKSLKIRLDENNDQIQNMTVLNNTLNDIMENIEQCNNDISDYTSRLYTYQDRLDELSDKKNMLSELQEDYETRLKNYNNLKLSKEYLIKARISFSCKYQIPVNNKFNEYIDICNNITGAHDNYSLDINNNLLKNEYGQEREIRFFSSGAKDIAGLCLRLAFINAMYKQDCPFIIMDDPFVNMDDNIINGAKRLIDVLSERYQIIYFACHESRMIN